jgi:hypothetical protein
MKTPIITVFRPDESKMLKEKALLLPNERVKKEM